LSTPATLSNTPTKQTMRDLALADLMATRIVSIPNGCQKSENRSEAPRAADRLIADCIIPPP